MIKKKITDDQLTKALNKAVEKYPNVKIRTTGEPGVFVIDDTGKITKKIAGNALELDEIMAETTASYYDTSERMRENVYPPLSRDVDVAAW